MNTAPENFGERGCFSAQGKKYCRHRIYSGHGNFVFLLAIMFSGVLFLSSRNAPTLLSKVWVAAMADTSFLD